MKFGHLDQEFLVALWLIVMLISNFQSKDIYNALAN